MQQRDSHLRDRNSASTFWTNRSINWKLNAAFSVLVLITLFVMLFSVLGGRFATQNINSTSESHIPATLHLVETQNNLLSMVASLRAYLVSSDREHISEYKIAKTNFELSLGEMESLATDEQNNRQLERISSIEDQFSVWSALSEQMFELHDNPRQNQAALNLYLTEVRPRSVAILGEMSDIIEIQKDRQVSVGNIELLNEMIDFQTSFDAIIINLHAYAISGDLSFRTSYMTRLPLNTAAWENLRRDRDLLTVEQQSKLDQIERLREELFQWPFEILSVVQGEEAYADLYLFRTNSVPQADDMIALLEEMAVEEQLLLDANLQAGRRWLSNVQLFTIISGLVALIIALGMAQFFRDVIAGALKRLTNTAEQIANGQLDVNATVESSDEIGQLADSFNSMTFQLKETIHDLEEQTKHAQQADRAKSRFLANMSHELRTPLNGILGYAQHLGTDDLLTQNQLGSVKVIEQSGQHLLLLIEDLLDISKIEANKLELQPTEVHFPSFIASIVNYFRLSANQKEGVEFVYDPTTAFPTNVYADEKRLRQILLNLLSNALKFTPSGSVTLRISVAETSQSESKQRFQFEIHDTGIGMTPEEIERIFIPFEQVGDPTLWAGGTGLGLAITQNLVDAMEGELKVESTVGEESTFTFEVDLVVLDNHKISHAQAGSASNGIGVHLPSASEVVIPTPPPEITNELYDLALKGALPLIGKRSKKLAAGEYAQFGRQLNLLVQNFDEDGILAYLEKHISTENRN